MDNEKPKYFPIFDRNHNSSAKKTAKTSRSAKKMKLSENQMFLDAGQKRFGATQCDECKYVYHMGDPGDEQLHSTYHSAADILRFYGWKNEKVVFSDPASKSRIIQIVPSDPEIWQQRVRQVVNVVNRSLGFFDMEVELKNSQVFFYIKQKTIVGVLVAEPKTTGHRLLTKVDDEIDLASEESYKIKCGVARIWVSERFRKKGVATCLMDALKRFFSFGTILRDSDIAFSSPTTSGKAFAVKYFKRSDFLVYLI